MMNVPKYVLVFLLIYVCVRVKSCKPTVSIVRCDKKGLNDRRTYYYYEEEIDMDMGCTGNTMKSITYTIIDEKNNEKEYKRFSNKKAVVLDIKTPGKYILKVELKGTKGATGVDYCTLTYFNEPPLILFKDGRAKSIKSGSLFSVDISPTKHYDSKYLPPPEWKVVCTKQKKISNKCKAAVCNPVMKGLKFSVQHNPCFETMRFIVTIKYSAYKLTDAQHVYIDRDMKINCRSNCDLQDAELSDRTIITQFELKCIRNCKDFKDMKVDWYAFEEGTSNKVTLGKTYSNTKKQDFLRGRMKYYDRRYIMTASVKGQDLAHFVARTFPDNTRVVCNMDPKTGYILETLFTITCVADTDYWKIHAPHVTFAQQRDSKSQPAFAKSNHAFVFETYVGFQAGPFVELKTNEFTKEIIRMVRIKDFKFMKRTVDDKYIKYIVDRSETQIRQGKKSLGLTGIISSLNAINLKKDITSETAAQIAKLLSKLVLYTRYDLRYLLIIQTQLMNIGTKDANLREAIGLVCKKIVNLNAHSLISDKYDKQFQGAFPSLFSKMDNCDEYMIDPKDLENLKKAVSTTTTELNLVDERVISEEYEDYDYGDIAVKEHMLQALDMFMETSKMIAEILPSGKSFRPGNSLCDRRLLERQGRLMPNELLTVKSANVTTGNGFKQFGSTKTAAIATSCDRKYLDPQLISTNIVGVEMLVETDDGMATVATNFSIDFDVLEEPPAEFTPFAFSVPRDETTWDLYDIDYLYNVHRINLPRGHSCLVKFNKITAGDKFRITFTWNVRPKLRDFSGTVYTIQRNKGVDNMAVNCPLADNDKEDKFIYMAILPHRDMLKASNKSMVGVKYHLQIFQQACLTIDYLLSSWTNAFCDARYKNEGGKSKVNCQCKHTSLFAAAVKNVDNKLDTVYMAPYETEIMHNYVLLIHVILVFLGYCIALAFLPLRMNSSFGRENVIYLSDNRKNDRYGYLIVVKTGSFPFSGTTSNVTIKLVGKHADSKCHVLNYPDPDKRFLKRDQSSWFVMTNDVHLGRINMIEIWIDSIGYRPSWYCENVLIIDLQNNDQRFFKVDKWFSVAEGKTFEATVSTSKKDVAKDAFLMSIQKNVRFHKGAENTWNIFSRLHDDYLTYHQRITIIMSIIYTTYILVIFFFKLPAFKMYDAYGSGVFRFQYYLFYCAISASLISCAVNFPFVYFFRNSAKRKQKNSLLIEDTIFGSRVTYITWGILCCWIAICLTYLLLSCYWVSYYTSLNWIVCTVCSLLVSIFVIENIYILVMKLLMIYFTKVRKRFFDISQVLSEVERQRKVLYRKFGELLMRPYFRKHYSKMSYPTYLQKKHSEDERMAVSELFRNMCVYLFFFLILLALVFYEGTDMMHKSNRYIKVMLSGNMLNSPMPLQNVACTDDIYEYLNKTLLPVIHPIEWYEGFNLKDPGLCADFNTKILGVVRLRQQRSNQSCAVHPTLEGLHTGCYNPELKTAEMFEYTEGSEKHTSIGIFQLYSSDGHTVKLGRTGHNSRLIVGLLRKFNWIDFNTRVLFIEFWAYNANYNIFSSVRIFFERDVSGRIITSYNVDTFRIIHDTRILEIIVMILVFLLLIAIFFILSDMLFILIKKRLRFFRNLWNVFDFTLVALTLTVIAIYLQRSQTIANLIEELEYSDNNDFVDYFEIIYLTKWYNKLLAFLVFLATIRIWKYLSFAKFFNLMEMSLKINAIYLIYAMAAQFYIFVIFCVYYYMVLGKFLLPFWNLTRALTSVVRMSLNFMADFRRAIFTDYGVVVAISFAVFSFLTLAYYSLYCTILMAGFVESKIYFSNKKRFYNLKTFLTDEAKFKREIMLREQVLFRLQGGAEDAAYKYVTEKEPVQRYADCVLMSDEKINLMRLIAILVIKSKINKAKIKSGNLDWLTLSIINNLKYVHSVPKMDKLQQNIFFRGKDPKTEKIKYVNNLKMLQMEFAVEKMLHHDTGVAEELYEVDILHMTGDARKLERFRDTLGLIWKAMHNIKLNLV